MKKKELIKAVHTQVSNYDGIVILSKTNEDAALDVLTNGMFLFLYNGRRCNVTVGTASHFICISCAHHMHISYTQFT